MSRQKGIADVSFNFEPHSAAPLDARAVVATKADLTNANTFLSTDGLSYAYKGMTVSVTDDEVAENNGLYVLKGTDTTSEESWDRAGSGSSITTPAGIASVLDNSEPKDLFGKISHTNVNIDTDIYVDGSRYTENSTSYSIGTVGTGYYVVPLADEYDDDHLYTITLREYTAGQLDIFIGVMNEEVVGSNLPPQDLTKMATIQLGDSGDLVTFKFDGTDPKVTYINPDLVDIVGYPVVPQTETTNKFLLAKDPAVESGTFVLGDASPSPGAPPFTYYENGAWNMGDSTHVLGWDVELCWADGEPVVTTDYNFDTYLIDKSTGKANSGVIQNIIDNQGFPVTPKDTASIIDGGKAKNLFAFVTSGGDPIGDETTQYASDTPASCEQNARGLYVSSNIVDLQSNYGGRNLYSITVKDMASGPYEVLLWNLNGGDASTLPTPERLMNIFTLHLTGDGQTKEFLLDGTDSRVTINPEIGGSVTFPPPFIGYVVFGNYYAESQGSIAFMDTRASEAPQGLEGACFINGERTSCDPLAVDFKELVEDDEWYNFDRYIYDEDSDTLHSAVINSMSQTVNQIENTLNTASGVATVLDGGRGVNLFNVTENQEYIPDPEPILDYAATEGTLVSNSESSALWTPSNQSSLQGKQLYSFTLVDKSAGDVDVYLSYFNKTGTLTTSDLPVSVNTFMNSCTKICTLTLTGDNQVKEYVLDGTDPKVKNLSQTVEKVGKYITVPTGYYVTFQTWTGKQSGGGWSMNGEATGGNLGAVYYSSSASRLVMYYNLGIAFKVANPEEQTIIDYQFDDYLVNSTTGELRSGILQELSDRGLPASPEDVCSVVDNGEYVNLFEMHPVTEQQLVPTVTNVGLNDLNSGSATAGGDSYRYYFANNQIPLQGKSLYSIKVSELSTGAMDVFVVNTGVTSGLLTSNDLPAYADLTVTKVFTINMSLGDRGVEEFVLDGTDNKVTYINPDFVDSETGCPVLPIGYHFAFKSPENTARMYMNNHTSGTAVADSGTLVYYVYETENRIVSWNSTNIGVEFKILDYQEVVVGERSNFDDYITDTTNDTLKSDILNKRLLKGTPTAIPNATDATDLLTKFNQLLSELRSRGVIADNP